MNPDNFRQQFEQAIAALDTQLARVNRELATLAAARPADPDVIAAAVARAQQASEAVGSVLGAAADAVGDPPPVWDTREELDATVQRLGDRMRSAVADRRRARLRAVAASLLAAQVIHPKWRKVVPALDALRLRAAAQVREAADAPEPPELPGPADGTGWLAWAWDLTPEQVEEALAVVRKSVPALAEVVLEIDPGHWVALAEAVPASEVKTERLNLHPPSSLIDPDLPAAALPLPDSILPTFNDPVLDAAPVPLAEVVAAPTDGEAVPPSEAWVEEEPAPVPPPRPKVTITPVVVAPPNAPDPGPA